jgi:2-desacetyl-2-hydroxyethyl bacteriochlorophyllide A dehydrogenase
MTTVEATYAVFSDQYQAELQQETIDFDTVPPYGVILEAETTVISAGTELAIYSATAPGVRTPGSWNAYPWRPGYGLVGRVLATGTAVDRVQTGDRVFCFGKHASHQIYNMSSSKPMVAIYKIPEDLSATYLAMLRMALVAVHAPMLTTYRPGETIAVFGLGVVGNLAAQLYRHAGLQVIGLDPVKQRCDAAREAGLDWVLDVPPEQQIEAIHDLTGGRGADVTVEAVGHSAVVQNCVTACADKGQVILLGSPRVPYEGNLTQAFRDIHMRWLTMRGALEWRLPPYTGFGIPESVEGNLQRLLTILQAGHLNLDAVISHIVSPQDLSKAYDGLLNHKEDYLGVIVDWRSEHQGVEH